MNRRGTNSRSADGDDKLDTAVSAEILNKDERPAASVSSGPLSHLDSALTADIHAVSQIDAVGSILEVVCRITGMGFAAVARVTPDRWVACAVRDEIAFGLLPGGELPVKTTICDEIRDSGRSVVIDHVAESEQFRAHHTPRIYGLQSYISMPIMLANGAFFGTLCAIDPRPAKLNRPEVVGMFKNFAQLIAFHLDAQERLTKQDAALFNAQQGAELREQFIAVLAHDLRNPLASISAGADMMLRKKPDEKTRSILGQIQQSVGRMSRLIDDMLDLARGRLGGGFPLDRIPNAPLAEHIDQVVGELRGAWPNPIDTHIALKHPVMCDPNRIGQLLSNLTGNALKHGAPNLPVRVLASTDDHEFELSVINHGEPIDQLILERLFQPFFRGTQRSPHQGLGLGLYIASEIARAHGGTIRVQSTNEETRFTLRIPRA